MRRTPKIRATILRPRVKRSRIGDSSNRLVVPKTRFDLSLPLTSHFSLLTAVPLDPLNSWTATDCAFLELLIEFITAPDCSNISVLIFLNLYEPPLSTIQCVDNCVIVRQQKTGPMAAVSMEVAF